MVFQVLQKVEDSFTFKNTGKSLFAPPTKLGNIEG